MSTDPLERLRAANPTTAHEVPNLDALLTRAMATTPKNSVWRSFKVKMAAAASSAAALTVGVITLISSLAGPSTAPLALSASSASRPGAPTSAMVICQVCMLAPYHFVASGLSSNSTEAPVYLLSSPDPTTAATALATYLGLSVSTSSPAAGVVEITDANTTLDVAAQALGSLSISSTQGLALPGVSSTDAPTLEQATRQLIAATPAGYQLVNPQFSTTPADATTGFGGEEFVSFDISVDGHVISNLSLDAQFDPNGNLLSLNAPLFDVASQTTYPLASPAAGVNTLNAKADAYRTSVENSQPTTDPTNQQTGSVPPVSGTDTTTTPTVPTDVPLTDVSTLWELSALTGGDVALIPVYSYSGAVPGATDSLSWQLPALDPSVVNIPSDWTAYSFFAWGRVMPMVAQVAPSPSVPGATK